MKIRFISIATFALLSAQTIGVKPAAACGVKVEQKLLDTQVSVVTAQHPSYRCSWSWDDKDTTVKSEISVKDWAEGEKLLAPEVKRFEKEEYVQLFDQDGNGVVDALWRYGHMLQAVHLKGTPLHPAYETLFNPKVKGGEKVKK
jgi:hypothetical protein